VTLSDAGFWAQILFDASDALPDYIGLNIDKDAATSLTDWKIYKFTYFGSDITKIQFSYGSWDGRVALF
jgi:hypothetical protein